MESKPETLEIKVRIQRHLAIGYLAEDSGDFVFTICRRGFERLVGKRLKSGEDYIVHIDGRLIEDE
jgi:hypothetical protein